MNILYDALPTTINIGGAEYPIDTSFKRGLKCWAMLEDPEITENQKPLILLKMFYRDKVPTFTQEALDGIFWFMLCGKKADEPSEDENDETEETIFDYQQDSTYIFAAFMQTYNMDLMKQDLHWWRFKALLLGLPSNTKLNDIIGVRVMDYPEGCTPTERMRIFDMKEKFKIIKGTEKDADAEYKEAISAFERFG